MIQFIHSVLLEIRKQPTLPGYPASGICMQFFLRARLVVGDRDYIGQMEDWLCELMKKWPEYSGSPYYPVPAAHPGDSPGDVYAISDEDENLLWGDNPYGEARWRLLDWLIEELAYLTEIGEALAAVQKRLDEKGFLELPYRKSGLCFNAYAFTSSVDMDEFQSRLEALMQGWPEYSGNKDFPVPHPSLPPHVAYRESTHQEMWSLDSEYGAARRRLLSWLVDQFKA